MSLKAFHVFFVIVCTIFCAGFGLWGINSYRQGGETINLWLGIASLVGVVILAVYFRWFLRKLKDQSYL